MMVKLERIPDALYGEPFLSGRHFPGRFSMGLQYCSTISTINELQIYLQIKNSNDNFL